MNVFDLVAKISLDTSSYENSLDSAEETTEKTGKKIAKSLGTNAMKGVKTIAKASTAIAGASIAGAVGIAKIGMAYNQEMEMYTTNFETMLGDEEKAVQKVNELKEFASSTPLSMADLAQGTQTLLAFGVENEKTTEKLRQLGDIALGDSGKMQSLANAYGKASAQGKLTGEVVQSMITAGFNPLLEISKKTGESMEEVQKRMSEGKVTIEELDEALQSATSEGGQFAGGMEKASHTTAGLMSTLQDNARALAGLVSGQLSESFSGTLLPVALGAIETLSKAFEEDGSTMFDGMAEALENFANFISEHLGDIQNFFSNAFSAISTILGGFWQGASSIFGSIVGGIGKITEALGKNGIEWDTVWNGISTLIVTVSGIIAGAIGTISGIITAIIQLLNGDFTGAWNTIKETISNAWQGIVEAIEASPIAPLIDAVKNSINGVIETAGGIVSAISNAFQGAYNAVVEWAGLIIGKIQEIAQAIAGLNPFASGNLPNVDVTVDAMGNIVPHATGYDSPHLLTSDTVFGKNGNTLHLGGDRGTYKGGELVYSREGLLNDIAIASGGRETTALLSQMINIMAEYFPQFSQGKMVSINGKALVGQIVNDMDEALGARVYRNRTGSVRG